MSSIQSAKLINSLVETNSLISKILSKFEDNYSENSDYIILRRFLNAQIKYESDFIRSEELLENKIFFESIYNDMTAIERNITQLYSVADGEEIPQTLKKMAENVKNISSIQKDLLMMHATNTRIEKSVASLIDKALSDVKDKVNQIDAAMLALEHHETDKIYLGLSKKYKWEYFRNNFYFFTTLIIVGCVSWNYSASLEQISNFTNGVLIAFIAFKILLISIAITLITLFLRRSSHAKKLQDQAYQTHVEISAFPIHVRSLKEDDQHSLVKELAMKYFGKELDHSQTDKAGDLMAEQIRISTEMVKASAEMVKSVKPSGASESSEPK